MILFQDYGCIEIKSYTSLEIEQVLRAQEEVLIQFYLDRKTNQRLQNFSIDEDSLKKIFQQNQLRYQIEEKVKLDTIFIRNAQKAREVFKNTKLENFQEQKNKYNERKEDIPQWIPVSSLHPMIYSSIQNLKKGKLAKELVEFEGGAHILYLIDRDPPREASYEEAKETLISELKQNAFQNLQRQLIEEMIQEPKTLEHTLSDNLQIQQEEKHD
ncbi:peptidyl-prolyl cis-trans isomerase [Fusobacterium necrophorum]|nr:peptidyl-prolyl cis-trans isomerase [Fusobacterium necrophorum]AZW08331.1 peptidyl-prolyl cis-trans isomerase [Fusobacterium necrophorum subsp. necrophorum]